MSTCYIVLTGEPEIDFEKIAFKTLYEAAEYTNKFEDNEKAYKKVYKININAENCNLEFVCGAPEIDKENKKIICISGQETSYINDKSNYK